jgi:hypothetical protein
LNNLTVNNLTDSVGPKSKKLVRKEELRLWLEKKKSKADKARAMKKAPFVV